MFFPQTIGPNTNLEVSSLTASGSVSGDSANFADYTGNNASFANLQSPNVGFPNYAPSPGPITGSLRLGRERLNFNADGTLTVTQPVCQLVCNANRQMFGLIAPNPGVARWVYILNEANVTLTVVHMSASEPVQANKINTISGSNVVIPGRGWLELFYDLFLNTWRVVS
jgi:hypothetical protein